MPKSLFIYTTYFICIWPQQRLKMCDLMRLDIWHYVPHLFINKRILSEITTKGLYYNEIFLYCLTGKLPDLQIINYRKVVSTNARYELECQLFVKRSQYIRVENLLNRLSEKAYMCFKTRQASTRDYTVYVTFLVFFFVLKWPSSCYLYYKGRCLSVNTQMSYP